MLRCVLLCLMLLCSVVQASESPEQLLKRATRGDASAQVNLGIAFSVGEKYGVEKDPQKSLYWFQKAADQNDTLGLLVMAGYYYRGDGVPKDQGRALKLYRRAAEQGDSTGYYQLGLAYSGDGSYASDPNPVLATQYFRRAAEQGLIKGQLALGKRLINGDGTEKNRAEGIQWLKKAASKGDVRARIRLWTLGEF